MDNVAFKTIPLEIAQEHFMDAGRRGLAAGKDMEHRRILNLLKEKGHYDAIITIKKDKEKTNGN